MDHCEISKVCQNVSEGLYRFLQILLKLDKAQSAVPRTMDIMPLETKWEVALVYYNNLITFP